MRTIALAVAAGALAACSTLSGTVDDRGRAYRETTNAPLDANLEPLAAEPSIQLLNERLPSRNRDEANARGGAQPDSACQAERWQSLIGMSEAEALAQPIPEAHRVVSYQGMVTDDYRPDRLNIHLDANGDVFRVTCG